MRDDEGRDEFVQTVLEQFSTMEAQMGQEGYQAHVSLVAANVDHIAAKSTLTRAWGGVLVVVSFAAILAFIPLLVMLWKVALRW